MDSHHPSFNRNRLIFILSLIGVVVAVYVTQSFLRDTGIVCLTSGCETVRRHPASWPLGIPVPAIGLVGYTALAILAFLRTTELGIHHSAFIIKAMLGITIFGISFVSWFTYTELFIINSVCTWCAVSTVNMFIIFLLTWQEWRTYVRSHR